MNNLPTELKVLLLYAVDDFSTLYNLIRTCRSIYNAFKGARSSILSTTLPRTLQSTVLRDALTLQFVLYNYKPGVIYAREADFLYAREANAVYGREAHIIRTMCISASYPLPPSQLFDQVSREHIAAEWLALDICATFMSNHKSLDFDTLPPTADEKGRIYRALYQIQILSSLFHKQSSRGERNETRSQYLLNHPLWEVEELACIWEYLLHRLYNLDSAHNGAAFGSRGATITSKFKGRVISQGLRFLRTFLSTTERDEYSKLVAQVAALYEVSDTPGQEVLDPPETFLGKCTSSFYFSPVVPPALPDMPFTVPGEGDISGPNAGWKQAFRQCHARRGDYLSASGQWVFRARRFGFCLWSKERLESSRLVEELGITTE